MPLCDISSYLLDVVAFFACGIQEAIEKFCLDVSEGCGETLRLVKAADLGFDPSWFTESRQKLVGNEQLEEGATLGSTWCSARRSQEPLSNK